MTGGCAVRMVRVCSVGSIEGAMAMGEDKTTCSKAGKVVCDHARQSERCDYMTDGGRHSVCYHANPHDELVRSDWCCSEETVCELVHPNVLCSCVPVAE